MKKLCMYYSLFLLGEPAFVALGWKPPSTTNPKTDKTVISRQRRAILEQAAMTTAVPLVVSALAPREALAQPQEFNNIGTQAPVPDGESQQFTTLNNGVRVKDFTVGTGGEGVVKEGNTVSIQCSGRLLNLNGVVFYNTKNNNPDGFGAIPLTFTIGKGEAIPGLESGIIGMKKNGIRRIIIPPELAYSQYPGLEPKPMSVEDQRALDSVIKNPRRDATILFDVKLERFK